MIHNYLVVMAVLLLNGCSTISWYSQALTGQMEIWQRQKPVDELLDDASTPDNLQNRLRLANEIRRFSIQEMGLPDNDSYSTFADLQRQAVLWAVFAAPADSVKLKQWCYPFVGCVGYRGFFNEADADDLAIQLRREGQDVYVAPVPAYSTLGWFTDPLLNTFIQWPEPYLVELMMHELAHQQLYIEGDSRFNESFATAVAEEGVRRWLASHYKDQKVWQDYHLAVELNRQIIALALKTRTRLQQLYAQSMGNEQKMGHKRDELNMLYRRISSLPGMSERLLNSWHAQELNNARLGALATYYDLVPLFRGLIEQSNGDMRRFYRQAEEVGRKPISLRQQALADLLEK